MNRLFDIIISMMLIILLAIPMLVIFFTVIFSSKGPSLYWSERVGKNNIIFKMPKFRSMVINTPDKATHLLTEPKVFLTPIGKFIRYYSIDELPQLFSVLKGDMSIVGPRPALFNQNDLIKLRTEKGVENLLPGITGWAQVNGRDNLSIENKVDLDLEYMNKKSIWFDIKIIWMTFLKVLNKEGVSH